MAWKMIFLMPGFNFGLLEARYEAVVAGLLSRQGSPL
jgi:hypothetical protein